MDNSDYMDTSYEETEENKELYSPEIDEEAPGTDVESTLVYIEENDDLTEEADEDTGKSIVYVDSSANISEEEMDAIADTAIDVLREILVYFNAENASIEEYEGEEQELIFDVVGDNLAMLIGRHGKTLEALQYLVSAIVTKQMGFHYPIVVDVEGYINRRKQKLIGLAKSSAARAIRQQRYVSLRPMSAYERRIIHMALKDDKRVKTESEGIDPNRQVVIYPV